MFAEISFFSISVRVDCLSVSRSDCIVTDLRADLVLMTDSVTDLGLSAEFRGKASEIWVNVADSAAAYKMTTDDVVTFMLNKETDSVLSQQNCEWSLIFTVYTLSDLRAWLNVL